MTELTLGLVLIGALVVLVLMGMHIAMALFSVGFAGVWLIREDGGLAMQLMYMSAYNGIADYLFATIPLFVLMGLLVSISNVGKDTFEVAEALLRRLRGGLAIATVAANMMFAAVTGVSIASAAVFTKIAVPEMVRHGYRESFAAGTVAGSSILGMLIPPSLLLIIYGVLAEQSIGKLFIAGLIPGVLMAFGFAVMIFIVITFFPSFALDLKRKREQAEAGRARAPSVLTLGQISSKLLPIVALMVLVLGGLYTGFFTPTEAGGVGAFGALVISLARRRLSGSRMWQVLKETAGVSVGILILLMAAAFYSRMLAVAGVPMAIADFVEGAGLGLYGFLFVYVVILLLMGMILDSSSILLIMTPIAVPIASALGFDLIQFGILTVIAVEIGLLTPPFGISVFTVKSTLNDPRISVESIFGGVLPYIAVMLLSLVFIVAFPQLTLALI
ncbi:MAG TPA: TRAP transporter large permease [Gammaproteobacteria bacterium]|nr:TRAP transporter large permease [Gammaproteobacteria bacterium]